MHRRPHPSTFRRRPRHHLTVFFADVEVKNSKQTLVQRAPLIHGFGQIKQQMAMFADHRGKQGLFIAEYLIQRAFRNFCPPGYLSRYPRSGEDSYQPNGYHIEHIPQKIPIKNQINHVVMSVFYLKNILTALSLHT